MIQSERQAIALQYPFFHAVNHKANASGGQNVASFARRQKRRSSKLSSKMVTTRANSFSFIGSKNYNANSMFSVLAHW